eukprot:10440354-Karenia_brevis.AAC.1
MLYPDSNPLRQVTFQPESVIPVDIGKRRSGQPRVKWTENTLATIWKRITNYPYTQYRNTTFNHNNIDHVRTIYNAARYGHIGYP